MRLTSLRVMRPLVLSFLILSCTSQEALGPTVKSVGNPAFAVGASIGPKVVISQVYGGGGNANATLNRDYVELFNAGDTEQPLSGWSIQYASATGTGSFGATNQITLLSGSIAPGQYVLVGEASGGAAGGPITPDISDAAPINMAAGAGKVALVNMATSLGCNGSSTACNATALSHIIDLVGYGNANFFEGASAAPTLSSTIAAFRRDKGCTDTNNNGSDFTIPTGTVATPSPRNRLTAANPCVPIVPVGPVVTVVISPEDGTVRKGGTLQMGAVGKDVDDHNSPTTFTWLSSDPTKATISATGLAAGVNEGTVDITATAANGVSATTTLSVAAAGGAGSVSIAINTPRQAPVGYTKPAFPTVKDVDGNNITTATTLTWSTSNTGIATVDNLGYVTGVAPGSVTIKATAPNGVFGTTSFTVIAGDAPTAAIYRNHLEFGTPTDNTPDDEHLLVHRQFVESYNKNRGGPNWVSWDLNSSQFGPAPRCDCFSADQTLPADFYHVVDFDYRNGLYDRGHMAQSESRTTTDQENASTFLLTNILPQGAENNQGPWSAFENYVNDLARGTTANPTKHEVYLIAGGLYAQNPGTLKGEGKVAIPDYTWKIAVIMADGKGLADVHSAADIQVIAVEMPNLITPGVPASSVGIRNNPWEQYKTKVDQIESQTGYDFLSALPDRIELLVESGDHPPVAVIGGSTTGVEGSPVSFDGTASSDPDRDALTYAWDFGDGTTGTGAKPTHIYSDNGSYVATLTVKDPVGADDSQAGTITVSNVAPVVKTLSATPTVFSGETVFALSTFGDAGVNDSPWSYVFDWGAGSTSTGSTSDQGSSVGSSRSFLAAGTYTVGFAVTDKDLATSAMKFATFHVARISTGLAVNPNKINIHGQGSGQLIVTVFGSNTIDASAIELESVRIGTVGIDTNGNDGFKSSIEDANNDGIPDLIVHFDRGDLVDGGALTNQTTQLVLLANLNDGRQIEARGAVIVSSKD
jgi:DNA/RNA endonuclease G (NUC1)/PKD repeat protein